MYTPLACSDYYETSAPSTAIGRQRTCPPTGLGTRLGGQPWTVPTFTTESIDEGGARLYPDSIATPMPQTFNVASSPDPPTRLQSWPAPKRKHRRRPRAAYTAHIRQV
jgi:hypothetical protein